VQHRRGEHRPPSRFVQPLQVRVEHGHFEIGHAARLALLARTTDQRAVQRNPGVLQCFDQLGTRAICRKDAERARRVVVFEQRSAIGIGELHQVRDDRGQHLVEVEARADRVADLPQGLELLDLVGELSSAALQGTHQIDVANGDRGLRRERSHQLDGTFAERVDVGAPKQCDADHIVFEQHRNAKHRPEPAEALDIRPAVLRVGKDIGDLLSTAVERDAAGKGRPVDDHRVPNHVFAVVVRSADGRRHAERAVFEQDDHRCVGPAQPTGTLDHGAEHCLEVGCRGADRGQDLAGRDELLASLIEVSLPSGQIVPSVIGYRPVARHKTSSFPTRWLPALELLAP
jgi:hypothetical protein